MLPTLTAPETIVLMSEDEFEAYVLLDENAERRLEYHNGEIVEVVSNNYSSELAATIISFLGPYVKKHKLGRLMGADGGFRIGNNRYMPDVAFISLAKQPHPAKVAYNPNVPDLVVEVLSPSDKPEKVSARIVNYLTAGVQLLWLVNPDEQTVSIFRPNQPVQVARRGDVLVGEPVLSGFTLAINDIFEAD